jgi:hypothetical protein
MRSLINGAASPLDSLTRTSNRTRYCRRAEQVVAAVLSDEHAEQNALTAMSSRPL